tara:strand:- start:209 stop:439 length:231 start_codon:yes stop_codon:yes gene_type:complete
MPQEGASFDDCHADILLWIIFVFTHVDDSEGINASHKVLFGILRILSLEAKLRGLIFFAKVSEIVEADVLLTTLPY